MAGRPQRFTSSLVVFLEGAMSLLVDLVPCIFNNHDLSLRLRVKTRLRLITQQRGDEQRRIRHLGAVALQFLELHYSGWVDQSHASKLQPKPSSGPFVPPAFSPQLARGLS